MALALVALPPAPGAAASSCAAPVALRFEVAGKVTRELTGFTQGLEFSGDRLLESTGAHAGTTRLNEISLSGGVNTLAELGSSVFGEGLTVLGSEVFQLTWKDGRVFVYDLSGTLRREMLNPRDGWGLTTNGSALIFTDGGADLIFADPLTFEITRTIPIRAYGGQLVAHVNEMEYVDGAIYGNVYTTDEIVKIDPQSGCVIGAADIGHLRAAMNREERAWVDADANRVANGIAFHRGTGLFYLTGKEWLTLFAGRFVVAAD